MSSSIPEVNVKNITMVDAQDGSNATKMASFIEQLRQTTGMDVVEIVNRITDKKPIQLDRIDPESKHHH